MLELLNEEDKKNAFVEDEVCVCVAHWSLVVKNYLHRKDIICYSCIYWYMCS